MAVLVEQISDDTENRRMHNKHKVYLYDTRAPNIDCLRHALGYFEWTAITSLTQLDGVYSSFLKVVKTLVSNCIGPTG